MRAFLFFGGWRNKFTFDDGKEKGCEDTTGGEATAGNIQLKTVNLLTNKYQI